MINPTADVMKGDDEAGDAESGNVLNEMGILEHWYFSCLVESVYRLVFLEKSGESNLLVCLCRSSQNSINVCGW